MSHETDRTRESSLARAVRASGRHGDTTRGVGPGRSWNPFEAERVRPGALDWLGTGADPESVLDAARATPVGLLIGPHGSGKSSLLRHVVAAAEARGLAVAVVHAERPVPSRTGVAALDLVACDGAGRGRPWWRWRLARRCRAAGTPLLLTAHHAVGGRVVHRRRPDLDELRAVVAACLEGAEADPPADELLAARLHEAHGSVRAVLWSLYEDWERGTGLARGWPDDGRTPPPA